MRRKKNHEIGANSPKKLKKKFTFKSLELIQTGSERRAY